MIIVGLAFLRDSSCVVRQYVLEEPGTEKDLLAAVAAELGARETLVTFNGKSFDVPMLAGRYHLHRRPDPTPPLHLDLLHPARRIWSRRLGRSNLSTLEARILGVIRDVDIPGAEIPGRYFAFVRDRRWEDFAPVVEHNRQDLVSLARLALRLELLLKDVPEENGIEGPGFAGQIQASRSRSPRERPPGATDERPRPSPSDLIGLGVLAEGIGRTALARRCYEGGLASAAAADRAEALHRLAALSHRADDLDRAVELYDAVTRYHCRQAILAAIELAKLHEHRIGDRRRALAYARHAWELIRVGQVAAHPSVASDLERRIARLEQKQDRDRNEGTSSIRASIEATSFR